MRFLFNISRRRDLCYAAGPIDGLHTIMKTNSTKKQRRDTFTFYRSYADILDKLPDEQQLQLYKAITKYSFDFEEPQFDDLPDSKTIEAIWEAIKPNLEYCNQRYLNGIQKKNSKADNDKSGSNRGSKRKAKGKQSRSKHEASEKQNGSKSEASSNDMNTSNLADGFANNSTASKSDNNIYNYININNLDKNNKEKNIKKEDHWTLAYLPFSSEQFKDAWILLMNQPKWKKKSEDALKLTLKSLGNYDEEFAIFIINRTISSGYQGLIFANTENEYRSWKKANNKDMIQIGKSVRENSVAVNF